MVFNTGEKYTMIYIERIVRKICEEHNILHVLEFVKEQNPTNDLPYHNWFHILTVTKNCYEGAHELKLGTPSTRNLLVAALFHDFDHAGGKQSDDVNIEKAILGFENFIESTTHTLDIEMIKSLIRVTQFPFIRIPVTIEQKILRDSDVLQAAECNWFEQVVVGLRKEFANSGITMTDAEMIKNSNDFYGSLELFTVWGRKKYEEELMPKIKYLEFML